MNHLIEELIKYFVYFRS